MPKIIRQIDSNCVSGVRRRRDAICPASTGGAEPETTTVMSSVCVIATSCDAKEELREFTGALRFCNKGVIKVPPWSDWIGRVRGQWGQRSEVTAVRLSGFDECSLGGVEVRRAEEAELLASAPSGQRPHVTWP